MIDESNAVVHTNKQILHHLTALAHDERISRPWFDPTILPLIDHLLTIHSEAGDMIRHHTIRYDDEMIWYDIIWYDMIWYDIIWYDMIRHHTIRYDDDMMLSYDMIWCGMIWYDTIRYDMKWYDMIWCDMIQ